MTGFLDGINESLVKENPIEDMTEDTEVNLGFDVYMMRSFLNIRIFVRIK